MRQAPDQAAEPTEVVTPQIEDASSKVYFPDEITPQSVAEARAQTEQQQVSSAPDTERQVAQLSDGESARALAQLTEAERQVLLEAVDGTDICERSDNIPAIQALCDSRLETRSADFRQASTGSAEDNLLGGGLDSDRVATLESAIARLAQNTGEPDNFDNQVIASVALGNQSVESAQPADGDDLSGLSSETQSVVNAIVQQLGGN